MVTQTSPTANIPKFGWSPIKFLRWWLSPRSTERDERFRERALRITVLLLLLTTLANTPFLITPQTTFTLDRFLSNIMLIVGAFLLLGGATWLIQKQHYIAAAWILLSILLVVFLQSGIGQGMWLGSTIALLGLTLVYGQIILPQRHSRYIIIIIIACVLITLIFQPPIIDLNARQFTMPVAVAVGVIFAVLMNTLLSILRQELQSRLVELRGFVKELDNRVQERTAQLEERTQELEIARQKAEDANTIKTRFLANMSHELRTPLNAILNFTAFVADGVMGDVNEEQEEALRQSISSGKHLLALINDILDVTKIEAGLMDLFIQQVDFNEVLGAVVAIGKGLSKDKPVQLMTDIQDKMPISYGDKRRIRQVFLNIVSNAFKFTREGSVTIHAHATTSYIHVKVTDTGVGIAPENNELVFESFKQVQNDNLEVVGTGLRMPISKYFVESHHGKIWFESTVGVGTTFYVELPILTEEEANALRLEVL